MGLSLFWLTISKRYWIIRSSGGQNAAKASSVVSKNLQMSSAWHRTSARSWWPAEKILQHLTNFHKHVENVRFKEQQYFEALRTSGIPVNTLPDYESSVLKSEGVRRELKIVVEKMTQRIHELQTGMM